MRSLQVSKQAIGDDEDNAAKYNAKAIDQNGLQEAKAKGGEVSRGRSRHMRNEMGNEKSEGGGGGSRASSQCSASSFLSSRYRSR